jgi:riboflavin kinase/FMN adenylyltransferase
VTIGVFDGVHRVHQVLIRRAVGLAAERGVPSVLLTFDPHPSEVIRPGSHPAQLTTLRRKAELVEGLGVDVFGVLPFTLELSRLTAHEFVHEVLVDKLHAAAVIVGENFTFGHKAAGDIGLLRTLGKRFGFVAYGAELQGRSLADNGEETAITFSSTYVRSCIDAGDVRAAAEALGRPHRLEGIVVRGDGRGHDLGYPTANLSTPRFAAVPADGVYSCWFTRSLGPDRRLPAAVSVGTNPTFSGRERTVEAFVLDVDEDFYGQHVSLDFVAKLRDQVKFSSSEGLVAQIDDDVVRTREVLGVGS